MIKIGVISHGDDRLNPMDLIGLDQFIAVDGGVRALDRLHIKPNLIVGDFDSIDQKLLNTYKDIPKSKHPRDKNKSDTEIAVEIAYNEMEADQVVLFNYFGKRIDHSLYNVLLLKKFPELILKNGKETSFLLKGRMQLELPIDTSISLIPLNDQVKGVTTDGLKWNLDDEDFKGGFMSLSNVVVKPRILLSAQSGDLLVSYRLPQQSLIEQEV